MVQKEEKGPGREREEQEESGRKRKLPLKFIVLCLLGLALVGGGLLLWKGGLPAVFMGKGGQWAGAGLQGEKADIGPIYTMDNFLVNLVDPQGKRYLKLKAELELSSEETRGEVDRRLPQFKDTILTLLSSKTYADVGSLEGKLQLRAEIISMLNQYLISGSITNIYFTEFIVQ